MFNPKERLMEKYILIVKEGKVIIQEAEYIEDGFYIEIIGKEILLYEIPQFGGEEQRIGNFDTIIEAIEYSKKLT